MKQKLCSWCLLAVGLGSVAGASNLSSDLRSHPRACRDNAPTLDLPHVKANPLPLLVRQAIALLPFIEERQVVILRRAGDGSVYLVNWGYSPETASETIKHLAKLVEFTIDHHFPIFINAGSPHYRHILESWEHGKYPDEAARVLASDIYHEYRHAACDEEELDALAAQICLLTRWRAEGLLTIAGPYIASKESRRRSLAKSGIKSR
jgi:hypothetical protein